MDQNSEKKYNQIFDPIFDIYFQFFTRYKILIFLISVFLIFSTLYVYLNRNIFGKFEVALNINTSQLDTLFKYEKDLDFEFFCQFNRELENFDFLLNCKKFSTKEIQKMLSSKFIDSIFKDINDLQRSTLNNNKISVYINNLNNIDKDVFLDLFKDAKVENNINNPYPLSITVFKSDKKQLNNFLSILEPLLNILIVERLFKFDEEISIYYESKLEIAKLQSELYLEKYNQCKEKINIASIQKFNFCNQITNTKFNNCSAPLKQEFNNCKNKINKSKIKHNENIKEKMKVMENIIKKLSNDKYKTEEFIENNLLQLFLTIYADEIYIDENIETCQDRIKINIKNCENISVNELQGCKDNLVYYEDLTKENVDNYSKEFENIESLQNSCVVKVDYINNYKKIFNHYDSYINKYNNKNEDLNFTNIYTSLIHFSFNKNVFEIMQYNYIFFSLFFAFAFYIFLLIFLDLKNKYLLRKG